VTSRLCRCSSFGRHDHDSRRIIIERTLIEVAADAFDLEAVIWNTIDFVARPRSLHGFLTSKLRSNMPIAVVTAISSLRHRALAGSHGLSRFRQAAAGISFS
jgi:hypothetical protein